MSSEQYIWDFFIAHAGADKRAAEKLYDYLQPNSRVFLDSRSLMLGDDWDTELTAAQQQSLVTVVLISSKTEAAYYQREEIAAAIALARENAEKHRVVPVFLDQKAGSNKTVPYGLRLKHGLTVSANLSLKSVAERLLHLLSLLPKDVPHGQKSISTKVAAPQKYSEDILLNVSVLNTEHDAWYGKRETQLQYHVEKSNDVLRIEKSMDYLSNYEKGGIIEPIHFIWVPFEWDFPNLDLKIVNNSDETIFLTEVVFDVEESRLDPFPVLVIKPDSFRGNALHFLLLNEGWGEVRNLKARFHLTPIRRSGSAPIFEEPYPHEVAVGDFSERFNVNIADAFRDAGVDFDGLKLVGNVWRWRGDGVTVRDSRGKDINMTEVEYARKRASCLGPFKEGGAIVSGELEFDGLILDGKSKKHKVKFVTEVWLYDEHLAGVPAPPTYQYGTKFQVEGKRYQRRVSISHVLKPQEADRFNIKIGMDKSSQHRFRLKLLYNNEQDIELPEILLTAFIPRSGIEYLQEESNTRQP
jgi:hypothetical protein